MTTSSHKPPWPPSAGAHRRLVAILAAALVGYVAGILILAWVPPVSRDALTHHLAVPKLYLKHGAMVELPGIPYSYYPMNLDMLYLVPLYFGNDILPKYIHFAFALATAGLIYLYLRRRLGAAYGLAGVLLFLSLPVIVKLSITVYVDLGLIFFSFASLYFIMRWREEHFRWKYLIISAVFCGLALGTKYNGLVVFFLHTLFIGYISAKKLSASHDTTVGVPAAPKTGTLMRPLLYLGIYAATALIVFSPWAVRNIVWKGNPVYPLYHRVFQTTGLAVETSQGQTSETPYNTPRRPLTKRRYLYGEPWWYSVLTPIRVFFEGRDNNPQFFDGRLNPYLFVLTLLALWRMGRDPTPIRFEKKLTAVFAGCYLLYVFFSADMRIRYIAPIIAPMTLLSVYGLQRAITCLTHMPQPRKQNLLIAGGGLVLGAMVFLNIAYGSQLFQKVRPLGYISGRVDRQTYITRHRPEYTVYRYANDQLEDDARILGIYLGNRSYYLDRTVTFDIEILKKSVEGAASWEKILEDLQGQGFSHLLICHYIFQKWSKIIFNGQSLKLVAEFFQKGTRRLIAADGYGLYALHDDTNGKTTPLVSKNERSGSVAPNSTAHRTAIRDNIGNTGGRRTKSDPP